MGRFFFVESGKLTAFFASVTSMAIATPGMQRLPRDWLLMKREGLRQMLPSCQSYWARLGDGGRAWCGQSTFL